MYHIHPETTSSIWLYTNEPNRPEHRHDDETNCTRSRPTRQRIQRTTSNRPGERFKGKKWWIKINSQSRRSPSPTTIAQRYPQSHRAIITNRCPHDQGLQRLLDVHSVAIVDANVHIVYRRDRLSFDCAPSKFSHNLHWRRFPKP